MVSFVFAYMLHAHGIKAHSLLLPDTDSSPADVTERPSALLEACLPARSAAAACMFAALKLPRFECCCPTPGAHVVVAQIAGDLSRVALRVTLMATTLLVMQSNQMIQSAKDCSCCVGISSQLGSG